MTRYCLDTSAYANFKRGALPAVEALSTALWVGVPAIVLGELRVGFRLGRRGSVNERELERFLRSEVVEVLDVEERAATLYAEVVVALRQAGTPIPTNDIWIAALALREGASVLTYAEHFERVPRLGVERLRAG